MKADEILKKHEDANEMHFHEVDRKWIIEAMEEFAALRQPTVMRSVCCGEELVSFKTYGYDECCRCGKTYRHTDA